LKLTLVSRLTVRHAHRPEPSYGRFTVPGRESRTKLADFFSILLDPQVFVWNAFVERIMAKTARRNEALDMVLWIVYNLSPSQD